MNILKIFRETEESAVSVDWVVLTAAIIGLAIAGHSMLRNEAAHVINLSSLALQAEK